MGAADEQRNPARQGAFEQRGGILLDIGQDRRLPATPSEGRLGLFRRGAEDTGVEMDGVTEDLLVGTRLRSPANDKVSHPSMLGRRGSRKMRILP